MTAVSEVGPQTFPAWQGAIRAGSGFPAQRRASGPDRLELGAAVFSLPDPADARTTTWTSRDRQLCIFTGYLYNRRELADELGLPAEPAASPAEVVLEGYCRWNGRLLHKLEGAHVWAIWDQDSESLLCARDAIGHHPFYYAHVGEELVFSWDPEAVLRHPGVSRDVDRVVLAEHLTHHLVDVHQTFFRAVRRIPRGHALRFSQGRLEIFRYWDPVPAGEPVRWVTREELDDFPRLLRRAVTATLEAAGGRVGIFLSGGLDSVSVAAHAAEVAAERGWPAPEALSVIFPDAAHEQPIQRGVAQRLSLPQTFVDIRDYRQGPGLLHHALSLAANYPAPPLFVFLAPFLELLRTARSRGCGAVLTGDGGDELLGVTPAVAADLLQAARWNELSRHLRTLVRYWDGPALRAVRSMLWTSGLRALLREWIWTHAPSLALRRRRQLLPHALPPWVAPDTALRRELESRFLERWDRESSQGSFYRAALNSCFQDPRVSLSREELFFRNATAGIPTLHPYWHVPVAEFLLRTPTGLLASDNRSKGLIRSEVTRRFPDLGFDTQKKVVAEDFARDLFRAELPGLWRRLGPARRMAELGVLDLPGYQDALARRSRAARSTDLYEVWHGATIEHWLRCRL